MGTATWHAIPGNSLSRDSREETLVQMGKYMYINTYALAYNYISTCPAIIYLFL
jgi:hypothetical protein